MRNLKYVQQSGTAPCGAGATAGYDDEVVFANGTFIDGSTAEMSADGAAAAAVRRVLSGAGFPVNPALCGEPSFTT